MAWNGPSVFTIIPDWYMDFYADNRLMEIHYEAMKKWVLAMKQHQLPDETLKANQLWRLVRCVFNG